MGFLGSERLEVLQFLKKYIQLLVFFIVYFVGLGSNVTITIQANDGVAGQVGFDEQSRSVVVQEGSQVSLSVNRTLSVGRVSVDWLLTGTNASSDFVVVSGTVEFNEVGLHFHEQFN